MSRRPSAGRRPTVCCDDAPPLEQVATPGRKAISEVAEFLGVPAAATAKTLVLITDSGAPVMALLRGDHELNQIKLKNVLGCAELELATDEQIEKLHRRAGRLPRPGGDEDPRRSPIWPSRPAGHVDHRRQRDRRPLPQYRPRPRFHRRALCRSAQRRGRRSLPALRRRARWRCGAASRSAMSSSSAPSTRRR